MSELENYLKNGIALKREGKYKQAYESYMKALALDNNDGSVIYSLGKLCYILGDYQNSVNYYLKFCTLVYSIYKLKGSCFPFEIFARNDKGLAEAVIHCGHTLYASMHREFPDKFMNTYRASIDPFWGNQNKDKLVTGEKEYLAFEIKCFEIALAELNKTI